MVCARVHVCVVVCVCVLVCAAYLYAFSSQRFAVAHVSILTSNKYECARVSACVCLCVRLTCMISAASALQWRMRLFSLLSSGLAAAANECCALVP